MRVAIVKRALDDAAYCGDECGYWQCGGKTVLCIVDGLGHGKEAETAAKAAVEYVARHLGDPLAEIFAGCNRALRSTRGAVMGIAVIDQDAGRLTYAGVGNTRAMIVGEETSRLRSNRGIVGGGFKPITPSTLPLHPGDLVILFTDGVRELVELSAYSAALRADVERLAEKIIQDWRVDTDDAAVLVVRREPHMGMSPPRTMKNESANG